MVREIFINGKTIKFDLQFKKVKNINLRIKPDGTIHVSSNNRVPINIIDAFILAKAEFIFNALERYKNREQKHLIQYFTEDEVRTVIHELCKKVFPYFQNKGVKYPEIKFRSMISRWGSCQFAKGILTFNTNLMYAPIECIEYVVLHEFTHFLQANHSEKFYDELSKVCPDWKFLRRKLKDISIQK